MTNDEGAVDRKLVRAQEPPVVWRHEVFLPPGLYECAQALGRVNGLGASGVIRLALLDYLERNAA